MQRIWWSGLALLLAGCAAAPPPQTLPPGSVECRALYTQVDRKTDAAQVRDAGAYRLPGFPYLRVDRFHASFRDELTTAEQFRAWTQRLQGLDLAAREVELSNLATRDAAVEVEPTLRRLAECSRQLAELELADPARRELVRERAVVPDDYSTLQRFLGGYIGLVPLLNLGVENYHEQVRADFAKPLAELDAPGRLLLWRATETDPVTPADVVGWLSTAREDPLGIPNLAPSQWERLAFAHAPAWWIETTGEHDRPGTPVLVSGVPALDQNRPVTHFQPAFTRFDGRVLPQLVYTVWFSQRPPEHSLDSYAGRLDGLVWRVTLDADGRPLVYDTIHPCGCYHQYFPAKPLARRDVDSFWQETPLFPQAVVPPPPLAIRVQSGTHYIRRVVAASEASGQPHDYFLAEYQELLQLQDVERTTRSLFGGGGIVDGTERFERFWLWPSGVINPGAMRQWGRQATSFVGRGHFDDPGLLDTLFVGNSAPAAP